VTSTGWWAITRDDWQGAGADRRGGPGVEGVGYGQGRRGGLVREETLEFEGEGGLELGRVVRGRLVRHGDAWEYGDRRGILGA
jgi:hypothetical protein